MPLHYPKHNYLGPGTKDFTAKPVDRADEIAREHDLDYNAVRTPEDVYSADRRAIKRFASDFVSNPNLPSAVGAVGLGVKHVGESLIGHPIYPGNMPQKPWQKIKQWNSKRKILIDEDNSAGTPPKQARLPETPPSSSEKTHAVASTSAGTSSTMDSNVQSDMAATGAGATDAASANNTNLRGEAILPVGLRTEGTKTLRTYNKQYQLRIYNALHEWKREPKFGNFHNTLVPNYHELPVHLLGFYMHPSEIQRLRTKTKVRVVSAECEVYNDTAILTFESNASASNIGNNNVGVKLVQIDPEINKARQGRYENDISLTLADTFWGKDINTVVNASALTTNFTGQSATRIRRNWKNRYFYQTQSNPGSNATYNAMGFAPVINQQLFDINRYIIQRRNASMEEGLFCTWKYKPKNGQIFAQHLVRAPTALSFSTDNPVSFDRTKQNVGRTRGTFALNAGMPNIPQGLPYNASINAAQEIQMDIFRNQTNIAMISIDDMFTGNGSQQDIPVLAFGIEPVISIETDTTSFKAANCHIDITVNAYITLEIEEGVDYDIAEYNQLVEYDYKNPTSRMYVQPAAGIINQIIAPINSNQFIRRENLNNFDTPLDGYLTTWNVQPTAATTNKTVDDFNATVQETYKSDKICHPHFTRSKNHTDKTVAATEKEKIDALEKTTITQDNCEKVKDPKDNTNKKAGVKRSADSEIF